MALLANTRQKNSGLLRYRIGFAPDGEPDPFAVAGPLVGAAAPLVITVLGPDAALIPDEDNQVFGATAGSAAGFAVDALTLFTGAAATVAPWNASIPVAQQPPGNTPPEFTNVDTYIPAGTKMIAWFQASAFVGAQPNDAPCVRVQLRTFSGGVRRAGVVTAGPTYLTGAQVAIALQGANTQSVAGLLIVKLEHSLIDVPNRTNSDAQTNAV